MNIKDLKQFIGQCPDIGTILVQRDALKSYGDKWQDIEMDNLRFELSPGQTVELLAEVNEGVRLP